MRNLMVGYTGWIIILALIVGLGGCDSAQKKREQQRETRLQRLFGDAEGCFVMLDLAHGQYVRCNAARASKRFSPCSTFKIPNSLIGLETGVIEDAQTMIPWDGVERDRPEWNKTHTLRTAMANSVVWYYQELARRVGEDRMRFYINLLGYGNRDISGGLTQFWLGDTLKISADEQVEFLRKLVKDELPVSKRSMEIVRSIVLVEDRAGQRLYGKTGSDRGKEAGHDLGWYVGWVQRGGGTYVFATNMEGDKTFGPKAREVTLAILDDLDVWPRADRERK